MIIIKQNKTAILELTYKCNLKCRHCYLENINCKEQSTEFWIDVLSLLKHERFEHVIFSGGEPLLYKEVSELLIMAKLFGFRTFLFTNGLLIHNEIDAIINSCVDKVCISIYGSSSEKYDYMTNCPDFFELLNKNLELLSSLQINTQLRMIVTPNNKNEIPGVIDLSKKYNTELVLDGNIINKIDKRLDNSYLKLDGGTWHTIVQKYKHSTRLSHFTEECTGGCRAAENLIVINPNGDIYPCAKIRKPIGKIVDKKLIYNENYTSILNHKKRKDKLCLSINYN